jgi:hypothetical protein
LQHGGALQDDIFAAAADVRHWRQMTGREIAIAVIRAPAANGHAAPTSEYCDERQQRDTRKARLDRNPDKMGVRRQTVEHPFGTIKSWIGSTHFQMKTLKHVGTEMALHVLAYNSTRVMNIIGIKPLIAAIAA